MATDPLQAVTPVDWAQATRVLPMPPSKKSTLPVMVPQSGGPPAVTQVACVMPVTLPVAATGATVAVRVTTLPMVTGLNAAGRLVVVAEGEMRIEAAADELPL